MSIRNAEPAMRIATFCAGHREDPECISERPWGQRLDQEGICGRERPAFIRLGLSYRLGFLAWQARATWPRQADGGTSWYVKGSR